MFPSVCGFVRRVKLLFVTVAILLTGVSINAQNGSSPNNPLPHTPPAPGIIASDSFSWWPSNVRRSGDKGELVFIDLSREVYVINDFWLEYPGSSKNRWITATGRYGVWLVGGVPYFLPVPDGFVPNGITYTFDEILAPFPTALLPLPGGLNSPFEVSIDGLCGGDYPNLSTKTLSVGLTSSDATVGNLSTAGSAVLTIRYQNQEYTSYIFELRANGSLLATGVVPKAGLFTPMKIKYDPRTNTIGAEINNVSIGPFPAKFSTPKYAGFEGAGWVDNFLIRAL